MFYVLTVQSEVLFPEVVNSKKNLLKMKYILILFDKVFFFSSLNVEFKLHVSQIIAFIPY